jgi:hypothetical protein
MSERMQERRVPAQRLRALIEPGFQAGEGLELVHFSKLPVAAVRDIAQMPDGHMNRIGKPDGLWLSCEGGEDSWSAWCKSEDFATNTFRCRTTILLKPAARIIRLRTPEHIDDFTACFPTPGLGRSFEAIDWGQVAAIADGIIIAPYIWSRRLEHSTSWYYGWDCASGCIWNADCVASLIGAELTR